MDENKNNGELIGFDSAENNADKKGYTVTPEGGFYSIEEELPNDTDASSITDIGDSESVDANALSVDRTNQNFEPRFSTEDDASNGINGTHSVNANDKAFTFKIDPAKPKTDKKHFTLTAVIASAVIAAIIGTCGGIGTTFFFNSIFNRNNGNNFNQDPTNVTAPNNVNLNVSDLDTTVVEAVAAKVTPSVVGIRTTVSVKDFFYGEQESSGEGSGVAYTEDGYIITNYHVIQNAIENRSESSEIRVFLSYGDNEDGYPATVVGYNISYDLAVIKINVTGLTPIIFSDSSKLNVGQFVVAIGNPGGLQFMGSVTYGVISGLNRIISDTGIGSGGELIQTDAAINPGNSGGALVNIKGELVGINSSKLVSESYEGMGFAIPSNTTKEICDKIISKENDPDPYLGITISERYDAETLKNYGYPVGAVVYSVVPGSPADKAGIKSADIITELNGVEITDYTVLGDALETCTPGQTVSIKIYRSGRTYSANITIGSNNSQ